MSEFKIVPYADADEKNNVYAVCECLDTQHGIEIPRDEETKFVSFKCPKCGKSLGIMVRGKNT